jgi:hypothetical protein
VAKPVVMEKNATGRWLYISPVSPVQVNTTPLAEGCHALPVFLRYELQFKCLLLKTGDSKRLV